MNDLFTHIWSRKVAFLGTFFLVFTLTYIAFLALDFLPEPPAEEQNQSTEEASAVQSASEETVEEEVEVDDTTGKIPSAEAASDSEPAEPQAKEQEQAVLPLEITISKLDKTIKVLNPTSRTIADLDAALLEGVVRHPDSATLDQDGNVFILGHSSYLPQVFNKNFQAFNGIQKLEWGDTIEVEADGMAYEYRVVKVYRANAQDTTVPIAGTGKMLTLATCNSFGSVDDRYIVEAKQIGSRSL